MDMVRAILWIYTRHCRYLKEEQEIGQNMSVKPPGGVILEL